MFTEKNPKFEYCQLVMKYLNKNGYDAFETPEIKVACR